MKEHQRSPLRDERGPAAPSRESGSAYILTLMVLVVLSLLGIALALTTQSEVEIGANERTINRVFYSAEAGFGASVMDHYLNGRLGGNTYTLMDPGSSTQGTRVEVARWNQVSVGPGNYDDINQDADLKTLGYSVHSEATRFGIDSSGAEVALAKKNLELMLLITTSKEHIPLDPNDPRYGQ